MKRIFYLLAVVFIFTSCSKDIYVTYLGNSNNTGKIVLMPNTPTSKTSVTLNDNLIVTNKNVKTVTINNVPVGENNIKYVSANYWYKEKLDEKITVNVQEGQTHTKLIEVPPYSTGYWIYSIGSGAAALLILLML